MLGTRRHGEANAILEVMTRGHGRHLGLVRGGGGSRLRPLLQPGNSSARDLAGAARRASRAITSSRRCACMAPRSSRPPTWSMASPIWRRCAGCCRSAIRIRRCMTGSPPCSTISTIRWPPATQVVRFELQMLAELGFGLDLESCAATGAAGDLGLCVAEIRPRGVAQRRRALAGPPAAAAGVPVG